LLAIQTTSLSHTYKNASSAALKDLSLEIPPGEIFGLLGPNGGGKSTLFKMLTTLLRPTSGQCKLFDLDSQRQADAIRSQIGVVFQNPSLDKKLTVQENLTQQGYLYGLGGKRLGERINALLTRFSLEGKRKDLAETLSGGLRRRVELAKGLLHQPRLLLLDEPSTGLDPGVRRELTHYLQMLQKEDKVTILLTTHIMDEAQACDRLAILDKGNLVALGTPEELTSSVGGDIITLRGKEPKLLSEQIQQKFSLQASLLDDLLRIERPRGHAFVSQLVEAFPGKIESIQVGKPTLEDVFIRKTGHRFS
jgi:ABC-2 type transport system ATP-binding protein